MRNASLVLGPFHPPHALSIVRRACAASPRPCAFECKTDVSRPDLTHRL